MSKETRYSFIWIIAGLVFMYFLKDSSFITHWLLDFHGDSYLEFLPIIKSIGGADVFDKEVARAHMMTTFIVSPLLMIAYLNIKDEEWLSNNRDKSTLILVLLIVGVVWILMPVDGGRVMRFLCASWWGFSIASSLLSIVIAMSLRNFVFSFNKLAS